MIAKTEDEISAECLRVLKDNPFTKSVTHVPIIAIGPSCTDDNWSYGIIRPKLHDASAQIAHDLIMTVAGKWSLDG